MDLSGIAGNLSGIAGAERLTEASDDVGVVAFLRIVRQPVSDGQSGLPARPIVDPSPARIAGKLAGGK
jgi:hypothetical protein